MPYLETPDELAGVIADLAGIYGGCNYPGVEQGGVADCPACDCRIGFVADMAARIRSSVQNERKLNQKVSD